MLLEDAAVGLTVVLVEALASGNSAERVLLAPGLWESMLEEVVVDIGCSIEDESCVGIAELIGALEDVEDSAG